MSVLDKATNLREDRLNQFNTTPTTTTQSNVENPNQQ